MSDTNKKLVTSAVAAANNYVRMPDAPFMCLSAVRRIAEHALYGGRWEFYAHYLKARTSMRAQYPGKGSSTEPFAADIEASMKVLGLTVSFDERQAGDLIFNHEAAKPYGHVGMLIGRDVVLENIDPQYRPYSVHLRTAQGKPLYLSLTPIEHFRYTLLARLP